MAAYSGKKTFRTPDIGIAVPADTEFFTSMSGNDRYNRDFADNHSGKLLAINSKDTEVSMSPNLSLYYDLFTGNVLLQPERWITITWTCPRLEFNMLTSSFQSWFILGEDINDLWVSFFQEWGYEDDSWSLAPFTMQRTLTTTDLGVTVPQEFPYTFKFQTGDSSLYPIVKIPAGDGAPTQLSIVEVGYE